MNTRDLLELCQLDALGLLDEQEREEFDSAFAAAGPAIQAQIRAEQARLVKTDWIPCEAEPPAALREAVLGEMSLAMRVADLRPRVLGAIRGEMIRQPALDAPRLHGAGRAHPPVLPVRRVSRLWRAAALGFASASVAFAGTTLYLKGQFDQQDRMRQRIAEGGTFVPGPGLPLRDLYFNRDEKHIFFTPQSPALTADATLYLTPGASSARLVVWKLADLKDKSRDYRVVALTDDGEIGTELAHFGSDGGFFGVEVEIDPSRHQRIAIVDAAIGVKATKDGILLISDRLS